MIKWKLLLTTMPFVAAAVLGKVIFERGLALKGYVDFADVSAVLTAGAFLIGFMLAGTMSDYKESEKLPAELAYALEGIEDAMQLASHKQGMDLGKMRQSLLELATTVVDWMGKKKPIADVHARMSALMPYFLEMDKAGATAHAARGATELHNVRKAVTRIDVISKTGFLSSGYAILEVMVGSIVLLMVVARFKSAVAEYTLISFITLVYVYLLRLIKDIDDPFEYSPTGEQGGAAEVDLSPLLQLRDRLAARAGG